ncbi:hypothetical protein NBRC110019_20580 [Neptunitalea chrysea]|uniref:Uncharacterized protein n=1 Tax=Neptunitalea chrysea TaxID=1647581 RepID=A0A9W6EWI3_9FLAO|nr:hypothetical protein [Neptunitalea chrysea]GLB53018.1 hypothetical protein NBRC110019_20580 [Neptunitalea chrysea]
MENMEVLRLKLEKLTNSKLIDVVKNYRQYGYEEILRETALTILEQRGITRNDLHLAGNLQNSTYQNADTLYTSFKINSKGAFISYILAFVCKLTARFTMPFSEQLTTIFVIAAIVFTITYLLFFIRSFMQQRQFYKVLGNSIGPEGALLYLVIGMPFYFFMYFYFRKQMKQKIKEIR